jgi:hypothetical protein
LVKIQRIKHVCDDIGTERLDVLVRSSSDQLLKVSFFEVSLQRVDTGDAQHGCVKQAVDDVEGRNLRSSSSICEACQQLREAINIADVLLKLMQLSS